KNRGKHIEVINTGTSSWSPSQYYLEIKDKILTYSPDIVIIDYDMSDVQNDGDYKKLTTFDNDGLPVAIRSSNVENKAKYRYAPKGLIEISLPQQMYIATLNFLNKNSSFFYHFEDFSLALKRNTFVRRLLFKPPKSKNPELDADNWLQYNWTKKAQENIDYSMFLLGKTISLLKEHNVKVIITSNPNYTQYTKEWNPHPHIVVEQTARKYGALYLNAYQALKSSITGSLRTTYYWEFDPTHFNEAGNRIWARAQLNFLLDPANKLFE
ncbi:MAG TPA: SGNH/GDSL hydrolase family protein, partial [Methylomirabilota bacterium]|nr:SGNH/GDSL hydrolase family protein [Methylomirabilota bacterium]